MKRVALVSLIVSISIFALSQKTSIPSVDIKDIDQRQFNTSEISNNGKPIILSFWATWCKPCVKELDAISEDFEDLTEETGVKLFAVSIDNSRSMSRVSPFVNGKDWDYDVLLDPNGEFKRAMNVVNVPHTFLLDGKGNVVWQHTTYADGDEIELFELVRKLAEGKSIN